MITQAQIDKLIELSAPLTVNPLPWSELTEDQQDAFRSLMPRPSFDDIQRHYLSLWWLPVDTATLESLNGLMPPNSTLSPREGDSEDLWICADLLSDALDEGRLAALLPILAALPLTYKPTEDWPVPPEEEVYP